MSEFSENLHFRPVSSVNEATLREAVRTSGVKGVLYPDTANWRTFVPFSSPDFDGPTEDTTGGRLSRAVQTPVLEFHFAEDYFWAFYLWVDGDVVSAYTCEFKRKLRIADEALDLGLLESFLPPNTPIAALQEVLSPPVRTAAAGRRAAECFREILGFNHAEWLGPSNIVDRLEEIDDLEPYLIVGTPPAPEPKYVAPKPSKSSTPIVLSKTAWSAREAMEILLPFARSWSADVELYDLTSSPLEGTTDERGTCGVWIEQNGRTTSTGGWSAVFRSPSLNKFVNTSLVIPTSTVVTVSDCFNPGLRTDAVQQDWLDSTDVIAITEPLYESVRTADTPPLFDRAISLWGSYVGSRWSVCYHCTDAHGRFDLNIDVDAASGAISRQEQYSRTYTSKPTETPT